jgi:AraC-like DNA-binding protein
MAVKLGGGPMISVSAAIGLPEAIARAGGNADEILEPLGLRRTILATPHGLIPAVSFARALEDAARLTGDDCFGLHFGAQYHPKNVGPLAYVVLNSPTMAVAFANVARYLRVHNEAAQVSFERDERWAYLRHTLDLPEAESRQHTEHSLALGVGLIRLMVGSAWSPVEVRFAHKTPADVGEHLRVFGAPVLFGCATTTIVIDAEVCDRDVPAADSRLYPIMVRYLESVLEAIPREESVVTAVRKCIGEAMRSGEPTLVQTANRLDVGPRTLQRRLGQCGVDFTEVVADTRRRLALRYLRDRRHTITEVAFLLGYSEVSAFNRAFKRWTGSTPSEYRLTARESSRRAAPLSKRSRRA